MIVLATMHTPNINTLSKHTWEGNKIKYAEKHGYEYIAKTEDFYGFSPGFEKIQFLLDLMEENPDIDWVWWTGTDSMVMNHTTRIEDKLTEAGDYHIIMSGDFNFKINCDSMLVKNSPEARAWMQMIMDRMPEYHPHQFKEQQCMLDTFDEYSNIIKLMPQHFMNSYEYSCYTVAPWNYEKETDVNGDRGQWQSGDWLIHWPGTQTYEREKLIEDFEPKIIY